MDTKTYRIPKSFVSDHAARACIVDDNMEVIKLNAIVVRELKKHFIVTLTASQAHELLSDATYYTELGVGELGWEMGGLVASARATRDALVKAGVSQ